MTTQFVEGALREETMRLNLAAVAAAILFAGAAHAAEPPPVSPFAAMMGPASGQQSTVQARLAAPCPASGFGEAVYGIIVRNAGDGPAYFELANSCIGPEVRAAASAIGMGRSVPLGVKGITTAMFTAEGTFAVDGARPEPVKLDYQVNFMQPAARLMIQRAGGQRDIQVVNAGRAWNEATEGGAATRADGRAMEREAIAKLTPYGAIWSVVEAEGTARVTQANGKTVISGTSPYDGLPVTVTLDAENRPESMTLRAGRDTYGASFSDYRADLEPDYLYRFPKRLVWTKNGRPLADLTVTYYRSNPYVVFPVPAEAQAQAIPARRKRITPSEGFLAQQKPTVPTPRLANGKPDMTGAWNAIVNPHASFGFVIRFPGSLESDQGALQRAFGWNKPLYKPEFWDKVRSLDFSKVDVDPVSHCRPAGVPRQASPAKIMQSEHEIALFQSHIRVRTIPLDGRGHQEVDYDESFYDGVPAASWDGDTLVIKSIGFNGVTWLQWQGYFHTDRMEVTERLRREGELLFYNFTVEDPAVLVEPWNSDTFVSMQGADRYAPLRETPPCEWEDPTGDLYLRG
jgi:hypothetical protein